ncbi:MAG: hypothetical protein M1837_007393 [Sclerophora amabilis]|nr:MAG: hypothetical protein M1837_007393 [Sclerophora amabilis]
MDVAFIATAVINIISDFAMLVLPIGSIWQLQMPKRRKMGLSAVFLTGLFACISSIMRLVESVRFSKTLDKTYASIPLGLWTIAEIGSGIICGCLPVVPRFYRHFVHKVSTQQNSDRYNVTPANSTKLSDLSDSTNQTKAWHDSTYSTHLPRGNYLVLDETNHDRQPPGKVSGAMDIP